MRDVVFRCVFRRVQAVVLIDEGGELVAEEAHEVVARPAVEKQHVGPDKPRAVIRDRLDCGLDLGRCGREAWNERRHEHADVESCLRERLDGAQALQRMRGPRFQMAPGFFVNRGDADVNRGCCDQAELLKHVDVSDHHGAFGDDSNRALASDQRLQRSARQLVLSLDRLIGVGRGSERGHLARPPWMVELAPKHLDEVRFDENH